MYRFAQLPASKVAASSSAAAWRGVASRSPVVSLSRRPATVRPGAKDLRAGGGEGFERSRLAESVY